MPTRSPEIEPTLWVASKNPEQQRESKPKADEQLVIVVKDNWGNESHEQATQCTAE